MEGKATPWPAQLGQPHSETPGQPPVRASVQPGVSVNIRTSLPSGTGGGRTDTQATMTQALGTDSFPISYSDLVAPVIKALDAIDRTASVRELAEHSRAALILPPLNEEIYWNTKALSYRHRMRPREELFFDRLRWAVLRLREEGIPGLDDRRTLTLQDRRNPAVVLVLSS